MRPPAIWKWAVGMKNRRSPDNRGKRKDKQKGRANISAAAFGCFVFVLHLVAILLWLERAFLRHANVVGLFLVQLRQLDADPTQVKTRDFFVQMLG